MSFLFACLTGLGVGSGGLYILWLTLAKNLPQAEAQGLNLIFFSLSILSASIVNAAYKRVLFKPLFVVVFFGLLVSYPASLLAKSIDTSLLSRLFGGLLVLIGTVGFFSKNK